ncbi:hypothetical protein CUMW_136450 [Citrus unshiu]|nr:hypothetical protein CUMW_136450 [Citrus unshiu]
MRERPIHLTNYEEDESLAAYFLHVMKDDRLFEIFDSHILKEGCKDEIVVAVKLTKRCLNLNGKKRPIMREVSMKLSRIRECNNGASNIVRESCITGGLGMLLLVTKVLLLCKFMERKKEIKLKQKLFKRNGVKLIYEGKVNKLINEVVILSQINLETEVLLLVYEFISNGTVYQYINNQNEEFPIAWEMQLHIVVDSLADQTYMTTQVQGTFGYLDLQYFQSSPFTEKSNVYSFGLVLLSF